MDVPSRLVEMQVVLPPETKITKDAAEQFLMTLGHVSRPASFEVIGTNESILLQVVCPPRDCRQIREQLQSYFPEAQFSEHPEYLKALWDTTGEKVTAVVEYGLSKEFVRPLRTFDRFDPDPLAGLIGAMGDMGTGDIALFQVLFSPAHHPWSESIVRAVTDNAGDDFFIDDPTMVKLTAEKLSSPLFTTVIRVAAQSPKRNRAWQIVQGVGKSLGQFADAASNELVPLSNDEYDEGQHCDDVITRRSCRSGLIVINLNELVSLVLPAPSVSPFDHSKFKS